MNTIDADAHVLENETTWDFLERSQRHLRPSAVLPPGSERRYWFIDGRVRGMGARVLDEEQLLEASRVQGRSMRVPQPARDLEDVDARLAHMTSLGIGVQVLLPTLFIEQVADRAEVEVPLCRAYNRWLADIHGRGKDRLRWVVVPPLLAMDEARAELRFGKDHGACGVFMRGLEGDRLPSDPYFFPLYEAASDLDMPVVFHVGNANPAYCDLVSRYNPGASFWRLRVPVLGAFHALVMAGVPERFPRLRWGFLEAGAQWLPLVIPDLRRRLQRLGRVAPPELLESQRLYVALELDDDLPHVLSYSGEGHLVLGTDYGHADTASNVEALQRIQDRSDVGASTIDRILCANPRALYGI